MAKEIPFTQYLLPDGRKRAVSIERPDDMAARANALIAAGYRFECEILSDRATISLTVVEPDDTEDIAIVVVPNGPQVPDAVDRLIAQADAMIRAKREAE